MIAWLFDLALVEIYCISYAGRAGYVVTTFLAPFLVVDRNFENWFNELIHAEHSPFLQSSYYWKLFSGIIEPWICL